ncbi:ABC transporter ATP-binding protein, partial [Streptomyces sp. NPDC047022]|uniref:ABC transporter ATP-binding protein n=1 Tax=Streptomyces sp. NPDC047022 TaxID=3155737 RepID=UPI0033D87207
MARTFSKRGRRSGKGSGGSRGIDLPGLRIDPSVTRQRVRPGTVRRIIPFARRYRRPLAGLLLSTVLDAVIAAAIPVILKLVVDDGIIPRRTATVVWFCLLAAGLAVVDGAVVYLEGLFSGRVGEGVVFDLRTKVFDHVQRQPLAFFARAQTGALVSRLNADVIGARQALTSLLAQSLSALLTMVLVLGAMFYLSWQITVAALLVIPLALVPVRVFARRLQRLTREGMQLDAELSSLMSERFNVSGATLAKLYGRADRESRLFSDRAGQVRDVNLGAVVTSRMLLITVALLTAVLTALVYCIGGVLIMNDKLQLGTLVAMIALLLRLYAPVNQLSTIQS